MDKTTKTIKTLVYILPDKDAGVASVIRNLLRFKTDRFKTKVILIHDFLNDEKERILDDFNADKICRLEYNGKWSSKSNIYKKIINELDDTSIVISNDGSLEFDALEYSNLSLKVVYIMHGDFKHYYNVIKENHERFSSIITVSDYLKSKIKLSIKLKKNLILESIKFPVPKAEIFLKSYSDHIRLLFVGSLSQRKGVMSLKFIVDDLIKMNIKYQLSIIGVGNKEVDLKQKFKNNENVYFLGSLSNQDVFEAYKRHDILILPSLGEGLPVVIVEAMKHGVVPIASNLKSGIPELIENNVNGFVVDINSVKEYSGHIKKLHQNRIILKKMGQICVEKANNLFDPFTQATLYENAFIRSEKIKFCNKKKILDILPIIFAHKLKSLFTK